jgi:hypothetical protein
MIASGGYVFEVMVLVFWLRSSTQIEPSPQSGEMFIDTLLKRNPFAPEERKVLFGYQIFRSYGAWKLVWVVVVYKHLVPLGRKNYYDQNTGWFVTRTLESGH